jgi:mono/diheme cytochrome c family protein
MGEDMRKLAVLFLILGLLLVACGGDEAENGEGEPVGEVGGDPQAGEELFARQTIDSQAGCITCHSLEPDQVLVGPSMAGVAGRADERAVGISTEEYLRQSILEPDAHVVEGFPAGVMPQTYDEVLSDVQVDNLVAYLLTLE